MPFAIAGAIAAPVVGGLVSSAMGGGGGGTVTSGGGSAPPYYVPSGLGTADQSWQWLMQNGLNAYQGNNTTPLAQQSLGQGLAANSLYGNGYQGAANAAGSQYAGLASLLQGNANQNFATQNSLLNAGQNIYNMGLDPQNALYNRTAQQVTDQSNAVNSMYGLGSSGAGAGVTNQALSNFNIDWQNNQLSRAMQGLQGYGQAAGVAGQYGELGTSQASAVPGNTLLSGSTPYSTGQSIAATPGSLANTFGSYLNSNLYGPAEGLMNQVIPYMNYGQGAQAVPYQNQQNNANAWGGVAQNAASNIFGNQSVQNGLSNFFSPASGSFSGGDFSGAFSSSPYYSGGGNSYGFTM
ncbi:hypothetical protein [Burkholderia anthina]|uniref:hypothetical protein n=1 Tax=Burkholderia anthina TaxID=179879 RepID=UPI001AA05A9C|nr:hypothetical protein [Burkholderia anthina]QTD88875.1 hypothetical protein J4G50_13770 [Burkholderia anthina]